MPVVEVALPMPLSHGWIAHACRAAGLSRPRWNHEERVWTARTRVQGEDTVVEMISIRAGTGGSSVLVETETPEGESPTVRRVVTALLTGMQWAIARRRDAARSDTLTG
jgi:hypothetical protein